MSFYRIAGFASAALLSAVLAILTWLVLTHEEFAPIDFFDASLWHETQDGYIATVTAKRDGKVCVCGGYQCPTKFYQATTIKVEATRLAYEGWLRPRYEIVKDPEAGDHPSWRRPVAGRQSCVDRFMGQSSTLYLNRDVASSWLKLSIE